MGSTAIKAPHCLGSGGGGGRAAMAAAKAAAAPPQCARTAPSYFLYKRKNIKLHGHNVGRTGGVERILNYIDTHS